MSISKVWIRTLKQLSDIAQEPFNDKTVLISVYSTSLKTKRIQIFKDSLQRLQQNNFKVLIKGSFKNIYGYSNKTISQSISRWDDKIIRSLEEIEIMNVISRSFWRWCNLLLNSAFEKYANKHDLIKLFIESI